MEVGETGLTLSIWRLSPLMFSMEGSGQILGLEVLKSEEYSVGGS